MEAKGGEFRVCSFFMFFQNHSPVPGALQGQNLVPERALVLRRSESKAYEPWKNSERVFKRTKDAEAQRAHCGDPQLKGWPENEGFAPAAGAFLPFWRFQCPNRANAEAGRARSPRRRHRTTGWHLGVN